MGFFSKFSNKNYDNEKWKNKYLDLLDTQEIAEKAQKVNQELLCKTIIRLTIIAAGIDPQLEAYLQRIRDQVKKGVDYTQLKVELENLTAALTRLDAAKPENDLNGDIGILFDFLRQHYHSDAQQKAFDALQKSYRVNDNVEKLFLAINQIIADDIKERVSHQQTLEFTPLLFPKDAELTALVLRFLERIDVPEGFAHKVDELKHQLKNNGQAHSFELLWDSFTSVLLEINAKNQSKQQEIDKFLTHITEQLTELGLTITDSGIALLDASLTRSRLDQSVSEQMNDLQNRSSNATQLEPLKQVISSHIAKITKEIQEHKQKEAIQREKYQRQLDELSQKIKAMELETGELQSKLITANTNAQRDVLTELPNRLAYDERLKMEIARWQRYHTPLCLVVMDIDYFKKINDRYGHQTGDKVLEHLAKLFSKNIRRADFIARFGGEEFVMLLPHTNKHSALKVTDKLRILVEQTPLKVQEISVSISISCGITQFFKGDTHESAFKRADQALYQAKEQGRNRCCMG